MAALPLLLGLATLLPLISFWIILCTARFMKPRVGGGIAVAAILVAGLLSFVSLGIWLAAHPPQIVEHHHGEHDGEHGAHGEHDAEHPAGEHADEGAGHEEESHAPATSDADADRAQHLPNSSALQIQPVALLVQPTEGEAAVEEGAAGEADAAGEEHGHEAAVPPSISGEYWVIGKFGPLKITISYYIDALTLVMFCMVTFIASCIHIYAFGYMHDEEHEVVDHEVTLSDGHHLHRPGRFPRFFQYLSLFCFSMLGLVLAGNIAMVFVFWELVGICSYFLIGFYVERRSASNAANKAFIVNRVGDFGFIIGLMAIWSTLGTFTFGDTVDAKGQVVESGIFSQLRPGEEHVLRPADSMVLSTARNEVRDLVRELGPTATSEQIDAAIAERLPDWRTRTWNGAPYGYWLLIIAGVGIFCGCVGKSAQFPLHVWLPDAMEGPTPVSALVHSATMVAAGVYLVGRFFPVFTPEVLLVIAITGCITLFMAATIAITATDIKRVLAYSTVSQLGYMMLALGIGGWMAGMMHLITHAFFKSLLFMCSGSVIHAVHTNEMPLMGGLRKKMPVTATTMLIGCLAIAGAGLPLVIGLSGYYSKDKILEQAFSFMQTNGAGWGLIFFAAAAGGAALTAFYMFRMWFLTFAGTPRDHHRYDHAHESPAVMYVPLVILSVFAIGVAWSPREALLFAGLGAIVWLVFFVRSLANPSPDRQRLFRTTLGVLVAITVVGLVWSWALPSLALENMLEQARPAGTLPTVQGVLVDMAWPSEPLSHAYATPITLLAFGTALAGVLLAIAMYGVGYLRADEVSRQFAGAYRFLRNKWYFDELYHVLFIAPTMLLARWFAAFDRRWIDGLLHGLARATRVFSLTWDRIADRGLVDGSINLFASWTYSTGLSLRSIQTGRIRQYVVFIVIATISIFVLVSFFWNPTLAG